MKNKMKWLGVIAFIAVIGLSMFSCDLFGDNFDDLNGDWDRGDIVVTFNNSNGVFTEIKSNSSVWIPLLNNGTVRIGDRKFRNLSSSGNLRWTGQELVVPAGSTTSTGWENTTLTISGQTLRVETVNVTNPVTTYTRR